MLIGGAPWRISRLDPRSRDVVRRLVAAGPDGVAVRSVLERGVARVLLDRGFAVPVASCAAPMEYATVVPVLDRADLLRRLLETLPRAGVVVVDDGSADAVAIAATAREFGARVVRHETNRGPAAARNTGTAATVGEVIAFVDSDCVPGRGWPDRLLGHFADPAVAVVAPRILAIKESNGPLALYQAARSALDMGPHSELVLPGARLGFVPSAALLVRRSALGGSGFDENMRLGEDVDLVWRLLDAGWQVRYDPTVEVGHVSRTTIVAWMRRTFEYGTSAADLERRHRGRLAPARVSAWNLITIALFGAGRPRAAAAVAVTTAAMLARRLRGFPRPVALAARTVAQGVVADGVQGGHLLRREWWPVGWAALALTRRSRSARVAAVCMLAPVAWDWWRKGRALDPARYVGLRLLDDAAYGSGVLASCLRGAEVAPLLPRVRLPKAGQALSLLRRRRPGRAASSTRRNR